MACAGTLLASQLPARGAASAAADPAAPRAATPAQLLRRASAALGTGSAAPAARARCTASPEQYRPGQHRIGFPLASYGVSSDGSIRQSSPTVATVELKGVRTTIVVFGDEAGMVYVVDAATCRELPGWPREMAVPPGQVPTAAEEAAGWAAHAVVESTPAVGRLDGPGKPPSIVVGAGSTWVRSPVGEVEAFDLDGSERWAFPVRSPVRVNANGVFSSPAIGPVVPGTGQDVVFGSWNWYVYVLNRSGRVVAHYRNAETVWSSPALFKESATSTVDDVLIGLDKTQTNTPGGCIGGFLADLRYVAGHLTPVRLSGCQGAAGRPATGQARGQAIWSSPAVGTYGGVEFVAVGTSYCLAPYGPGTDALYVYALGPHPAPLGKWRPSFVERTEGPVFASPAIGPVARAAGSPTLAIVDTSFVCPAGRQTLASCSAEPVSMEHAWEWKGKSFSSLEPAWQVAIRGPASLASPIMVPLQGERTDDVLIGSGGGLYPLDGSTGAPLYATNPAPGPQWAWWSIHPACTLYNSPAAGNAIGRGRYRSWYVWELCSYGPKDETGGLYAFRLPEVPGARPGWPMFRADPRHSGAAPAQSASLGSVARSG